MQYEYFYEPLTHLIVEDFFDDAEYELVYDLIVKAMSDKGRPFGIVTVSHGNVFVHKTCLLYTSPSPRDS